MNMEVVGEAKSIDEAADMDVCGEPSDGWTVA